MKYEVQLKKLWSIAYQTLVLKQLMNKKLGSSTQTSYPLFAVDAAIVIKL